MHYKDLHCIMRSMIIFTTITIHNSYHLTSNIEDKKNNLPIMVYYSCIK